MTVRVILTSTQLVDVRTFSTGDKVNTWRVTFQIDGSEMHTAISVPTKGSSSADLATKEALNKLHAFLREAEQDVASQQVATGQHQAAN